MRRSLLLRLGTLAASLLAAGILLLGPAASPAGALSPMSHLVVWLQRMPREVVVDGHCRMVDDHPRRTRHPHHRARRLGRVAGLTGRAC